MIFFNHSIKTSGLKLVIFDTKPHSAMESLGIISFIIIVTNVVVSYRGFSDHQFFNKYSFEVEKVLVYKDYKRLVTSGFLHVGWMHLIFNMLSLYFFSDNLENLIGGLNYLIIYLTGLVGGNLFALYIHRHHESYSSVGASGAVCGIIFSTVVLFPGMSIRFFGIPISIPVWFYGLAFVLYSIYGIRSKRDNIGHEAHLGGALVGLLATIIMWPSSLVNNYIPILLITIPSAIFIYFIVIRPDFLLINNKFFKSYNYTVEDRYNSSKRNEQEEIDRILEKIHKRGVKSLTQREKEKLKTYSESQ